MKSNRRNFFKTAGLGLAGSGMLVGCAAGKPEKSISNMTVAYIRESTVEQKYVEYGKKAKEDNFPKVSLMFTALAKAEGIHAANHQRVLEKLKGGKYIGFPTSKYAVMTTLENLQDGLETEKYEIEKMYPAFIEQAKAENSPEAIETFTWAYKVEIQHMGYYSVALTTMGTGSELNMPEKWFVCPSCGGTYAVADVKKTCYFDEIPKEKFLVYE
jgi:rubrerythrin